MAQQFDLYRTQTGEYVLVLQHDLLSDLSTRTVCLASPVQGSFPTVAALEPVISAGDLRLRIMPQVLATFGLTELGTYIGNFAHERDRIIRAIDVMLTGT